MNSSLRLTPRSLLPVAVLTAATFLLAGCGQPETKPAADAKPAASPAGTTTVIDSVDQQVSYGLGYNLGATIKRQGGLVADVPALMAGIEDALAGQPTRRDEADLQAAFGKLQERMMAESAKASEANEAAAKTYLETNRAKAGVTVTASGLQYEVLKSGTGAKPKTTDTVEVHYHGTLIDGTVFDSSVDRGETVSFPVTGVIPGWVEALQLMSVGDKWKLTIPPALGYGQRGSGLIPPGAALVFEVELIAIK